MIRNDIVLDGGWGLRRQVLADNEKLQYSARCGVLGADRAGTRESGRLEFVQPSTYSTPKKFMHFFHGKMGLSLWGAR